MMITPLPVMGITANIIFVESAIRRHKEWKPPRRILPPPSAFSKPPKAQKGTYGRDSVCVTRENLPHTGEQTPNRISSADVFHTELNDLFLQAEQCPEVHSYLP